MLLCAVVATIFLLASYSRDLPLRNAKFNHLALTLYSVVRYHDTVGLLARFIAALMVRNALASACLLDQFSAGYSLCLSFSRMSFINIERAIQLLILFFQRCFTLLLLSCFLGPSRLLVLSLDIDRWLTTLMLIGRILFLLVIKLLTRLLIWMNHL